MDFNRKGGPEDYPSFMKSIVQLDVLERITQNLDSELADSQNVMLDIKAIFDSIPTTQTELKEPTSKYIKREDVAKFLDSDVPKLLLPDMAESDVDLDLDDIIAIMKGYAEDLKKNYTLLQTPPKSTEPSKLDLGQYANSLDQLSKRLSDLKLNKKDESFEKNPDLEVKLTQLCNDVNMFTQMVQSKTTLSESNKSWGETQGSSSAMHYDNIINKLLSGVNEVSYLLQNKK